MPVLFHWLESMHTTLNINQTQPIQLAQSTTHKWLNNADKSTGTRIMKLRLAFTLDTHHRPTTALPSRPYSAHCKDRRKTATQKYLEKRSGERWIGDSGTSGGRWRWEHKTHRAADEWSVASLGAARQSSQSQCPEAHNRKYLLLTWKWKHNAEIHLYSPAPHRAFASSGPCDHVFVAGSYTSTDEVQTSGRKSFFHFSVTPELPPATCLTAKCIKMY